MSSYVAAIAVGGLRGLQVAVPVVQVGVDYLDNEGSTGRFSSVTLAALLGVVTAGVGACPHLDSCCPVVGSGHRRA